MSTATDAKPMTEKLVARNDFCLIRLDDAESISKGGIVLPEGSAKRPNRGTVVAIGPGRPLENGSIVTPPCAVGHRVLISQYAMQHIEFEGEDILVVRQQDVIAVIDDDRD